MKKEFLVGMKEIHGKEILKETINGKKILINNLNKRVFKILLCQT